MNDHGELKCKTLAEVFKTKVDRLNKWKTLTRNTILNTYE